MRLERCTNRWPDVPRWAVVVVGVWLGIVAANSWLIYRGYPARSLCMFRAATGRPCPSCGSTRMVLAAAHGRVPDAIRFNPLMFLAMLGVGTWLSLRVTFKRRLVFITSPRARRIVTAALAAALLANWVYLLATLTT